MPEYWVEGADKETGADVTILVTAASEAQAAEEARGRGVLVSSVRLRVPPTTASTRAHGAGHGTGWVMSGVIASGVVALLGYIWTAYVLGRLISSGIKAARSTPGGAGSGFGSPRDNSLFDSMDVLALVAIPIAAPIVISVFFHCVSVGLYGLRARLLALRD